MPRPAIAILVLLFGLTLESLTACRGLRRPAPSDVAVQALVDEALARAPLFSGVALVSRHGRIVGQSVRGLADRTSGVENTPQTLFSIASVGKMVTAEAIDGLVQRGMLSLGTPVSRILPELATGFPDGVTIDALLRHRSGLNVAYAPSDEALEALADSHDLYSLYVELGLSSDGPAGFRYNNANFVLLGEIVARLTGQPYETYVRQQVLRPQELDTPVFIRLDAQATRPIARPYMPVDYETWWNSDSSIHGHSAADYTHLAPAATPSAGGGALATAADMARFIARLADGEIGVRLCGVVSAAEESGYARGCSVRFGAYGRRYGHTGSTAGVQARVFAYPDQGYEIVVLSNHDGEAAPVFEALETGLFGVGESPDLAPAGSPA